MYQGYSFCHWKSPPKLKSIHTSLRSESKKYSQWGGVQTP